MEVCDAKMVNMENPKVLIIDDEPALQQALQMALRHEGYQLFFADNGRRGLELFHRVEPELIFLDLKMPVMNGHHFLQALKITPDSPYTVIVITGHGIDQEIERCYDLGIDFFLRKPLSMLEICRLARRCIEEKRLKADREQLILHLQQANETINYLQAFLIMCSSCKQVRDDQQNWHDLDAYVRKNSVTRFSHSICPKCMKILYPDIAKDLSNQDQIAFPEG